MPDLRRPPSVDFGARNCESELYRLVRVLCLFPWRAGWAGTELAFFCFVPPDYLELDSAFFFEDWSLSLRANQGYVKGEQDFALHQEVGPNEAFGISTSRCMLTYGGTSSNDPVACQCNFKKHLSKYYPVRLVQSNCSDGLQHRF